MEQYEESECRQRKNKTKEGNNKVGDVMYRDENKWNKNVNGNCCWLL